MAISNSRNSLYIGYFMVIALIVLNRHNPFFWDTVQLGSAHATYYTSSHFSDLILPVDFDSGHIPTFGLYIAFIWKIFGRNLEAGHLAMLPFAIGIVWQLYKLCAKFVQPQYLGLALLMILADPSLMAQITLVSPDVPLAFFFLMGVNAVLENRKFVLLSGILLLFLTSMRGMMVSVCLLFLDLYCNFNFRQNLRLISTGLFKRSLIYLPGFTVFALYNFYHFKRTGWIGYHKDSPWITSFEPVGIGGIFYNIATLGWRLIDFGRLGIWTVLFILLLKYRKKIFASKQTGTLAFFCLCMLVVFPANMLWAKNLLGHRYLIPVFLIVALLCAHILFSDYVGRKWKYGLSMLWVTVLVSGNFWIYPDKIAKGWDSTLAHLPYYKLRAKAIQYIDKQKIDYNNIQTFFPNALSRDLIELNGDTRRFGHFDGKSEFVLYSNIYNIPDEDYDKIMQRFKPVKIYKNCGVYVGLYKNIGAPAEK